MKHIQYIILNCIMLAVSLIALSCVSDDIPQSLPPDIHIHPADSITRTSARVHGTIVPKGEGTVRQRYFMYGTSADGASMTMVAQSAMQHDAADQHLWHADITDLTPATDYYYRLYAGNERSLVASDTGHFTTMPNAKPTLTKPSVLSQGPLSIICSYTIADDGGSAITETGCYLRSADGMTLKVPDSTSSVRVHQMRIASLSPNTTYTLSAYAVNAEGESETAPITFTTADAIVLAEAGHLSEVLDEETIGYYASHGHRLNIAGNLDGDDIFTLRSVLGESSATSASWNLNLANANIVAGGGSYGYGRFTDDNVVSYGMFANCAVHSVVLPDDAIRIEYDAFLDCPRLTDIVIPASAVDILPSDGCHSLTSLTVSGANTHFSSIDGVLFDANASSLVWFPLGKQGNYTLPQTVTTVGDYAFRGCSITSFCISEGVTRIGQGAFADSRVQEVTLPSTLRAIPTAAFQNSRNLTTVRLGSGTELISDYAFDGCPLSALYINTLLPPVCRTKSFSSYEATLYVPSSSVEIYKNHNIWSKFQIKPIL